MTVRELIEKLSQFPDNCIIMVPNQDFYREKVPRWAVPALNVTQGVNELDGIVLIDDYVEEDEDETN